MSEKEKTMSVYNTGQQRFLIKKSADNKTNEYLEPGEAAEVSVELGKKLLQYRGVKDASQMVKSKSSEDHEKTIEKLNKKIEELEDKIKDLLKKK